MDDDAAPSRATTARSQDLSPPAPCPPLSRLDIDRAWVTHTNIVALVKKFGGTLRTLKLKEITIVDDKNTGRDRVNVWSQLFGTMAEHLRLEEFSIAHPSVFYPAPVMSWSGWMNDHDRGDYPSERRPFALLSPEGPYCANKVCYSGVNARAELNKLAQSVVSMWVEDEDEFGGSDQEEHDDWGTEQGEESDDN